MLRNNKTLILIVCKVFIISLNRDNFDTYIYNNRNAGENIN